MRFVLELIFILAAFGLGYWVARHEVETRDFLELVKAKVGALINRKP